MEANKGSAAILVSTMKTLKEFMPDAEFTTFAQLSKAFSKRFGIKVIADKLFSVKGSSPSCSLKASLNLARGALWSVLHHYLKLDMRVLISNRKLKEYAYADLIIHIGGDNYTDSVGIHNLIEHSKEILLTRVMGKPAMLYAESIVPFQSRIASAIARFTLNKMSLITVREEESKSYLLEKGINKPPIFVTADPAFLLEAASEKRLEQISRAEGIDVSQRPLIVISTGATNLWKVTKESKWPKYVRWAYLELLYLLPEGLFKFMVSIAKGSMFFSSFESNFINYAQPVTRIVNYLTEKLNATVVLMQHAPEEGFLVTGLDILKEICNSAKHREKVKLIAYADYTPGELKGIIGQCDLLVSTSMHAIIAALSQCVPVVAIGFTPKYKGIMGMLGQDQYISNSLVAQEVISKIEDVWFHREEIKKELKSRQEAVGEKALLNAKLAKELLDSDSRSGDKSPERSIG